MIVPGSWLGLLGGGQLGRMFAMEAQRMGYKVAVIDPSRDAPAKSFVNQHICAEYSDLRALKKVANLCKAVTTEFENVPAESLAYLSMKTVVAPSQGAVEICQDRINEKEFLSANGFRTAPFEVISMRKDINDIAQKKSLFPGLLKISRFGYDGKGQARVSDVSSLLEAFEQFGAQPCVVEKVINLQKEISVVAARGFDGKIVCYPPSENIHVDGILDMSIVPAEVSTGLSKAAIDITVNILQTLKYVGVLCVEFFIDKKDRLIVNEIAPRPHNSGHLTIDAFVVSQFEQQVRTLCGLPLGEVSAVSPAVAMVNLLGDLWVDGEPSFKKFFNSPNTRLYLYGKTDARAGRKMGHFTVLGATASEVRDIAVNLKEAVT